MTQKDPVHTFEMVEQEARDEVNSKPKNKHQRDAHAMLTPMNHNHHSVTVPQASLDCVGAGAGWVAVAPPRHRQVPH